MVCRCRHINLCVNVFFFLVILRFPFKLELVIDIVVTGSCSLIFIERLPLFRDKILIFNILSFIIAPSWTHPTDVCVPFSVRVQVFPKRMRWNFSDVIDLNFRDFLTTQRQTINERGTCNLQIFWSKKISTICLICTRYIFER